MTDTTTTGDQWAVRSKGKDRLRIEEGAEGYIFHRHSVVIAAIHQLSVNSTHGHWSVVMTIWI